MRLRLVHITALAASLALVAAGCATAQEDGSAEDSTFRYAYTIGVSRFDPHKSSTAFDSTALALTYDRLVHRDANAEPVPGLAEDWEFVDDGRALLLHIRRGVTFHDGEPLNAEAVAANLERALTVEGTTVASAIDAIEDVSVEDEYTVRLEFDGPGGHIPLALSGRAGMQISPAAFDNEDLDQQPVGAGMYRVAEYRQGELIVFQPYQDYWDSDAVNVDRFEFRIIPDEQTRLNAMRDGQVHATFLDHHQWEDAEAQGFNVDGVVTLAHYAITFDRSTEPFDDVRVRQAINYAIDREALVQGVLFGHGEPTVQPFPGNHWAHNPEVADRYPYDPQRARDLLAEAGYGDGLEFEIINPGLDLHTRTAEAVQAQLKKVGITMNIRTVETIQAPDVFFAQGEGDAIVGPSSGPMDPSLLIEQSYTPGFFNVGDHTIDEVLELHRAAMAPTTLEERSEAFQPLIESITDNAMSVYLFHDIQPNAWTDEVSGYQLQRGPRLPEFRGVSIDAG